MVRIVIAIVLLMCSQLLAWGGKEHVQLTRIAAQGLMDDPATPEDMKAWLRQIIPEQRDLAGERDFLLNASVATDLNRSGGGVLYWVMVPDDLAQNAPRDSKVEPFGMHERLMHFIELELFVAGNKQRKFAANLSAKPLLEDIRRDWRDERYIQAGYLPFAVETSYQRLVLAIRENRLEPADGVGGRDDDSAMRWAGYLAHYLQDNTQPHHSTVDFKSRSYFNDRRDAPDIHKELEWRMVDDERESFPELRSAYWDVLASALREFEDPISQTDPWLASVEVSFISYDCLPLIGEAAVAAATRNPDRTWHFDTARFFHHTGEVGGVKMSVLQMKARQQAWAVKRTQAMWLAAWREGR
ncbi:MAG TPA: hypothetical protein PLD59_08775 [Tepidisphaeraceae bacterium]|nr:hypothetical protein [Tepidisphaeraceae bacterium]